MVVVARVVAPTAGAMATAVARSPAVAGPARSLVASTTPGWQPGREPAVVVARSLVVERGLVEVLNLLYPGTKFSTTTNS